MKINQPDAMKPQGLFGIVGGNGSVDNLKVKGEVTGKYYVGGIIGSNCGSWTRNLTSDVKVTGKFFVGGIIGAGMGGIENCASYATVKGSVGTGGIAGFLWKSMYLNNCYSKADVSSTVMSDDEFENGSKKVLLNGSDTGGITGRCRGGIFACTFDGKLAGQEATGGIAGNLAPSTNIRDVNQNATVEVCAVNASISGTSGSTGAVVGSVKSRDLNGDYILPKIYLVAWNSAKAQGLSAVGRDRGSDQSDITPFTDVSTIPPSTFLLEKWIGGIPLYESKTFEAHFYPEGASLNGVEMAWACLSEDEDGYYSIPSNHADITAGQGTNIATVTTRSGVQADEDVCVGLTVNNMSSAGNLGGYSHTIYYEGCTENEAAIEDTPFTPADTKVEANASTFPVQDKDDLPAPVQPMVDDVNGQFMLSADKVVGIVKEDAKLKAEIDTSADMQPITAFTGTLFDNGNVLVSTFRAKLDAFKDKKFSEIALLKIMKDGSPSQFGFQKTPIAIADGEFAICNLDGTAIDENNKPAEDTEYLINIAVKDGGSFDIDGAEDGTVTDPAIIAAKASSTPTPDPVSDKGGSSGCAAGFGALALLAMIPIAIRRKS